MSARDAQPERLTWDELSEAVGVDVRHMRRLRQESGAPPNPDLAAWQAWMSARRAAKEGPDELKAEKLRQEIRKLTLANDALEKQLVQIDEVFETIRPTLSAFRTSLDNLAHRAALKLGGDYQETVEVIQSEVDIALRTFANAAWFDEQAEVAVKPVEIDTSDIPPTDPAAKVPKKRGRPPKQ